MVLREAMGFFYFGKRGVDRRIRKMIHIAHVAIVGLEMFEPGDTYAGDML